MLNKRGQITILLLIGLVLVFIFFIVFNLTGNKTTEVEEKSSELMPVKQFTENCLKKTAEDGIYFISAQGGYYNVPEPMLEEGLLSIPYYFYLEESNFPDKSTITEQYKIYIEDGLNNCINDFASHKKDGYDIKTKEFSVEPLLGKITSVTLHYPITIKEDDSETTIEDFFYDFDFNFDKIYDILLKIKEEQERHEDYIPIRLLANLAYSDNFTFEIEGYPLDTIRYTLKFNESEIPVQFSFAVRYNWSVFS